MAQASLPRAARSWPWAQRPGYLETRKVWEAGSEQAGASHGPCFSARFFLGAPKSGLRAVWPAGSRSPSARTQPAPLASAEMAEQQRQYLRQVEDFCTRARNDWFRVYLVRKLTDQHGMEFVQSLSRPGHPARWVFPGEVLAQQVSRGPGARPRSPTHSRSAGGKACVCTRVSASAPPLRRVVLCKRPATRKSRVRAAGCHLPAGLAQAPSLRSGLTGKAERLCGLCSRKSEGRRLAGGAVLALGRQSRGWKEQRLWSFPSAQKWMNSYCSGVSKMTRPRLALCRAELSVDVGDATASAPH